MFAELRFLPAHYLGVKDAEIERQQGGYDPGLAGHGKSRRNQGAAKIQGIPRMRIWTAAGQCFALAQMPGRGSANQQPQCSNNRADENRARRRTSQPEAERRSGVT